MITNEHYYTALNIMDKIEEIREESGVSKVEFGRKLGFTKPYYHALYNSGRTMKISSLIKLSQILNISVGYLLGNNAKKEYQHFDLDYSLLINTKVFKLPNRLSAIRSKLKNNNTKFLTVKTLFEFEYYTKIPAIKLIGGE